MGASPDQLVSRAGRPSPDAEVQRAAGLGPAADERDVRLGTLEREIEQTRADLARTIGAIEEKVSPRRIARDHLPLLAGIGGGFAAFVALLVIRKYRK